MADPNRFYVYEHWRPDKDVCFYVGKGAARRALWTGTRGNNKHYLNIVQLLVKLGLKVDIRFVAVGLCERDALDLECKQIALRRAQGVRLVNATDGGDGVSGYHPTEEAKAKNAAYAKTRIQSAEERATKSLRMKGKKIALGYKFTPEQSINLSRAMRGRLHKDGFEARAKESTTLRREVCVAYISGVTLTSLSERFVTNQTVLKRLLISEGVQLRQLPGRKGLLTEEHRTKVCIGRKAAWARQKAEAQARWLS